MKVIRQSLKLNKKTPFHFAFTVILFVAAQGPPWLAWTTALNVVAVFNVITNITFGKLWTTFG